MPSPLTFRLVCLGPGSMAVAGRRWLATALERLWILRRGLTARPCHCSQCSMLESIQNWNRQARLRGAQNGKCHKLFQFFLIFPKCKSSLYHISSLSTCASVQAFCIYADIDKTLPKAQRTRGVSLSCQSNFLRKYHKFKNKS